MPPPSSFHYILSYSTDLLPHSIHTLSLHDALPISKTRILVPELLPYIEHLISNLLKSGTPLLDDGVHDVGNHDVVMTRFKEALSEHICEVSFIRPLSCAD